MIAETPTTSPTHDPAPERPDSPAAPATSDIPHPTSDIAQPTSPAAPSLPLLALALLNPAATYEQIADQHNIPLQTLIELLDSPDLQRHLLNLAAIQQLRRQQKHAAANDRAVARLLHLTDNAEDPVEQRRAAAAVTRITARREHSSLNEWSRQRERSRPPDAEADQADETAESPEEAPDPQSSPEALLDHILDLAGEATSTERLSAPLARVAAPHILDREAMQPTLQKHFLLYLSYILGFTHAETTPVSRPPKEGEPPCAAFKVRFQRGRREPQALRFRFIQHEDRWLLDYFQPTDTS